jgi:hypothetical protein
MIDLVSNGHSTVEEIDKEEPIIDRPKKNQAHSVVCDLKQARWEQVDHLNI